MKHLKSTFFLAGTAIGSGLISLPIILAAWGIYASIALIIFVAIITYFSALVRCELNLQSKSTYTLKQVGNCFSGKQVALLGDICLKLLCFTLLVAYIHELISLLGSHILSKILISFLFFVLLVLPINMTLNFNKLCFYFLTLLILYEIISFAKQINLFALPNLSIKNFDSISLMIPTLFTAFGFQGSLHSLTKFCNNEAKLIRKACFWGCFITATIYILWTLGLRIVLFQNMPEIFNQIVLNPGQGQTAIIALKEMDNFAISCITILTIMTSIIGVGISLMDDINENFHINLTPLKKKILLAGIIVFSTSFVANICIQAFVKILSFAGCILALIAIFIPLFLLNKVRKDFVFSELNRKVYKCLMFSFGMLVILNECINILKE